MYQIWEYQDALGVTRRGISAGFGDFGGTDITYRFWRLDEDDKIIRFDSGGVMLDSVNGPRLKAARRVGAIRPEDAKA